MLINNFIVMFKVIISIVVGDLNCPTCAMVRGGLVGAVIGGFYPVLLALPVNAGLATRWVTSRLYR